MDAKVIFLRFIDNHLRKRAISGSVKRERIYRCANCNEEVEGKRAIAVRLEKGFSTIICQYCDEQISLIDLLEKKFGDSELIHKIQELNKKVEDKKASAVGITTTRAKEEIGEFDVFLAHNNLERSRVIALGEKLKERGINPWIDIEQVPPGRWFQDILQQIIRNVKSAAILIDNEGLGKWHIVELRAFISQCIERKLPVIPVLLPNVSEFPSDLIFLKELNWIKFHDDMNEVEALDNLEWGITGKHPKRK